MTETPEHIKQMQLNIWLSKSPMERLFQFLQDNEALYNFWKKNSTSLSVPPVRPELETKPQIKL